AVLKGFIFQLVNTTELNFFGLAAGTYYVQLVADGNIEIFASNSDQRLPLWLVEFDGGQITAVTDQREFITNPKILLTELIESRKTNATIIGTQLEPFEIEETVNDVFIFSIDGKDN